MLSLANSALTVAVEPGAPLPFGGRDEPDGAVHRRAPARTIRPTIAYSFINYYPYGSALALALDLSLRERSAGKLTLDDYMRALWRVHGKPSAARPGYVAKPYTLEDARARLAEMTDDRAFADEFFSRYVEGREVPDYAQLLAPAGVVVFLSTSRTPLSRANRSMPVRAMGRTNAGMFASRASAPDVHRTGTGSSAWPGCAPSVVGIIAGNGHLPGSAAPADAPPPLSGPMRTPSDWTICVSYTLVSMAIS